MKKSFGTWGIELNRGDRAGALAALGLVDPAASPDWPAVLLAESIAQRLQRQGRWLFDPKALRLDPRVLQQAWVLVRRAPPRIPWIPFDPASLDLETARWLEEALSRPEVGVDFRLGISPAWDKGTQSYPVEGNGDEVVPRPKPDPPPGGRSLERKAEPSPRFLQARLRANLHSGGDNAVAVRIGREDQAWLRAERPFPAPDDPERQGHQLTVLFWEARVSPEAQAASLWLPPEADSAELSFPFEIPAGVEAIEARITVLHANRVLQTGVLRARVGGEEAATFRLDAAPRTNLDGLDGRRQFDAALVLDGAGGEGPHLTAAADGKAAVVQVNSLALEALTRFLDKQISDIASRPEHYAALDSPGSVKLLRTLAQKGGRLRQTLCGHTGLHALADAKRIHLTSAQAASFLPLELLYSLEPPDDDAVLCPRASESLRAGECLGGCAADQRRRICPLAFWGLSRILERHAHRLEDAVGDGFRLQAEPLRPRSPLPLTGTSLLAASSKASEVNPSAVDDLGRHLGKRGHAVRVSTWKQWEDQVSADAPSLLVLLPHHERNEDDQEILEIGEGDRLKSELVREGYVRREDGPYPIVLLLGCDTNQAKIAFDSFVTCFRDKGAAVVVSTLATILGRDASPAAALLVDLLDQEAEDGNGTFGEIMLHLRRQLLATQTPMALCLTAYGDADWVLTKQS